MATRPLFVPVDMSTVVPSFNSTALTTFFSLRTLMLFSFFYWTTIKPICRIVILSGKVEKRNNMTHKRSTIKKYIQRWARNGGFLSDHGHDHVDLLGIVNGKQRESTGLPNCSFKRSAQVHGDFSDRSSLGSMFWRWYK